MDSPLLHARIYTHSARAPRSLSLRAKGAGGCYAVSCRLCVPLGVRLQANLSEKKKKWGARSVRDARRGFCVANQQNESEFRQGSVRGGCLVRRRGGVGGGEEG